MYVCMYVYARRSKKGHLLNRCRAHDDRIYLYTYMHACIHTYIDTYIHRYIHTYIHTCIHTVSQSIAHWRGPRSSKPESIHRKHECRWSASHMTIGLNAYVLFSQPCARMKFYVCMCVCMYASVYMCRWRSHIHTKTHTYTPMCYIPSTTHAQVGPATTAPHTHIHIYMHAYIYKYIHTITHVIYRPRHMLG
jgi:hypothetical protein